MRIAIVYDSRTGTTKGAAEDMARKAIDAGHEATAVGVHSASPAEVSAADAICIGSWVEGLFFVRQHATEATMRFIDQLELDGTPAAVFCTYKTAVGKMLSVMATALEKRGARVTGRLKSRGPTSGAGFEAWLQSLPATATPPA
jgi:menaquinone-dependent protoporphyrinogen IX oxidase